MFRECLKHYVGNVSNYLFTYSAQGISKNNESIKREGVRSIPTTIDENILFSNICSLNEKDYYKEILTYSSVNFPHAFFVFILENLL